MRPARIRHKRPGARRSPRRSWGPAMTSAATTQASGAQEAPRRRSGLRPGPVRSHPGGGHHRLLQPGRRQPPEPGRRLACRVRAVSALLSDAGEAGMTFLRRRANTADRATDGHAGWSGPPRLAVRSCCCPARPVVRILIPPGPARPRSVDLLLRGHHYLAPRAALTAIGAAVIDVTGTVVELAPAGCQRS